MKSQANSVDSVYFRCHCSGYSRQFRLRLSISIGESFGYASTWDDGLLLMLGRFITTPGVVSFSEMMLPKNLALAIPRASQNTAIKSFVRLQLFCVVCCSQVILWRCNFSVLYHTTISFTRISARKSFYAPQSDPHSLKTTPTTREPLT